MGTCICRCVRCVCTDVYMGVKVRGQRWVTSSITLHFYFFRTGSLSDFAKLTGEQTQGTCPSPGPVSVGIAGLHQHAYLAFYVYDEDPNSGPPACAASTLLTESSPQPQEDCI